jgi:hypothetical protein
MLLTFGNDKFNHLIDIGSIEAISSFNFKRDDDNGIVMYTKVYTKSKQVFDFYWDIYDVEMISEEIIFDKLVFEQVVVQNFSYVSDFVDDEDVSHKFLENEVIFEKVVLNEVVCPEVFVKWTYDKIVEDNCENFQKALAEYNAIIDQYKSYHALKG